MVRDIEREWISEEMANTPFPLPPWLRLGMVALLLIGIWGSCG